MLERKKLHMNRLVALYLVVYELCAPITLVRMKQNGISAYKQPNVKFMSRGICFSVINYQHWLQVKRQKDQL